MTRYGCLECGEIVRPGEVFTACTNPDVDEDECPAALVTIRTAADRLAFELRMTGQASEAQRVERDMAVLQEHRRGSL